MEKEIEKLQLLVMDHEKTIETLSESYHRQQERIEALQIQVQELARRFKSLAESLPANASPAGHEIPPHY
ncbi:MAG: SlyX family protein [Sedimenticolaceae bacterium]|nr:SlyX family protein [Sedimenticolaceae bacterium]